VLLIALVVLIKVITNSEPMSPGIRDTVVKLPQAPTLSDELRGSTARKGKVVIAGLFQNNGQNLGKMYRLMKQTVSYFDEHMIVFFENDSTDKTADTLRGICQHDSKSACLNMIVSRALNFYIVHQKTDNPFSPFRFSKMSFFRNSVLSNVKRLDSFDHFVFVDPDMFDTPWLPGKDEFEGVKNFVDLGSWGGSGHGWEPTSVLASLHRAQERNTKWNAICFYGTFGSKLHNYDMLAFRPSKDTPIPEPAKAFKPNWGYSEWATVFSAEEIYNGRVSGDYLHYGMVLFNFHQHTEFIPVSSCFGGLTIYNLKGLKSSNCTYSEQYADCEHVSLHDCINDKLGQGTIFIDPQSHVIYDSYAWQAMKNTN